MDLKIKSIKPAKAGASPLIPDYNIVVMVGDKEVPLVLTDVSFTKEKEEQQPSLYGVLNLGPLRLHVRVITKAGLHFEIVKLADPIPDINNADLILENMEGIYPNYRLHFSEHQDSILLHTASMTTQKLLIILEGRVHLDGVPFMITCVLYPEHLGSEDSHRQRSYIQEIKFCD